MTGVLYCVATPIGNLEDITLRALRILSEVDKIAAEDTRHTLRLLNHYNLKKTLISYHAHNRMARAPQLIKLLAQGEKIALVSNAGTPGISDPGHHLVELAHLSGVQIVPIPGPSAVTAAFSISGLSGSGFIFCGWLSPKKGRRRNELSRLKEEKRTLIFYEAPHRLVSTLKDMEEIMGNRHLIIARELTKKYEEVMRGEICALREQISAGRIRGEFTLVLKGI